MTRLILVLTLGFQLFYVNAQQGNSGNARTVNGVLIRVNDASVDAEANFSSEELVRQVLFTSCANLSNFSEVAQDTPTDTYTKSYGFFKRTAGSTFPFEAGVVMSTGKAYRAANTSISSVLSDNLFYAQPESDTDLENALALSPNSTTDRTVIEFDFIPSQNSFSFNFLMASEEYHGNSPCNYFDGFAFLLKQVGAPTYTNLAVVPSTTTPISCETVHSSTQDDGTAMPCGGANETYFDVYDSGDTNFNGRTAVFTASSTVVAGQTYHIKLVVADHNNALYDSAVFLEAGSFDIGSVEIKDNGGTSFGTTIDLCAGDTIPNLNIDTIGGATYQWQFYNITTATFDDIVGETTITYQPTQDGTYNINVSLGSGCVANNEVLITHHQTPVANYVSNLLFCDANNDGIQEHINLTNQNTAILNGQNATLFEIRYFDSSASYIANTPIAIPNDYTNITTYTQTIIAEIRNINNHVCLDMVTFTIHVYDNPTPSISIPAIRECDNTSFGTDTDGINTFDLTLQQNAILNGQSISDFIISYFSDSAYTTQITAPTTYQNTSAIQTIYVLVANNANSGCSATTNFEIEVYALPTADAVPPFITCDSDFDAVYTFDTSALEATVLGAQTGMNITYFEADGTTPLTDNNGTLISSPFPTVFETGTKDIVVFVSNPSSSVCTSQTMVQFVVNPKPYFEVTTPQAICLGTPITLSVENPSATYEYQWFDAGVLLTTTVDLLVSGSGDYTVVATDMATACTSTATIHVDESSIANFTMDDIFIMESADNNTVTILTDNLGAGDYQFSMDNSAYQDGSFFTNVSSGIHTVTVDDKLNCGTVTLSISIIGFPKFLTPNGDAYHDTWQGIGLGLQPNSIIYIYDRFTKLIHVQSPLTLGWDGTYNGKEAPATDYWYKAVLEDGRIIYGHFTLKR